MKSTGAAQTTLTHSEATSIGCSDQEVGGERRFRPGAGHIILRAALDPMCLEGLGQARGWSLLSRLPGLGMSLRSGCRTWAVLHGEEQPQRDQVTTFPSLPGCPQAEGAGRVHGLKSAELGSMGESHRRQRLELNKRKQESPYEL